MVNTDAQGISELAVTTLTNDFMPLIRYRIGDLVERQERPYYTSYVVHGRAADAFVAADGRRVTTWQIDQCLADLPGIAHYQLCERAGGEWLLRFVPDVTRRLAEWRTGDARRVAAAARAGVQQTDLLASESPASSGWAIRAKPI